VRPITCPLSGSLFSCDVYESEYREKHCFETAGAHFPQDFIHTDAHIHLHKQLLFIFIFTLISMFNFVFASTLFFMFTLVWTLMAPTSSSYSHSSS
jgi:hypothetical protein